MIGINFRKMLNMLSFFIDWQLNVNPLKSEVVHHGQNTENGLYHIGGTAIYIKMNAVTWAA